MAISAPGDKDLTIEHGRLTGSNAQYRRRFNTNQCKTGHAEHGSTSPEQMRYVRGIAVVAIMQPKQIIDAQIDRDLDADVRQRWLPSDIALRRRSRQQLPCSIELLGQGIEACTIDPLGR